MSLNRRCAIVLAALAALPASAAEEAGAGAHSYGFDPVHTRVMFALSHAGFSQAIGTVSGAAGTLRFDPADWRGASLDVQVPLTRLDLGEGKWNQAALARNLLDGKRFPVARFVSARVEPAAGADDRFQVCGTLTLHGVDGPLCLEVKFNALKRHPLPPFHRTAGFSATGKLSRAAFGIDAWKSVIGDEVELRIEAEAVRDKYVGDSPRSAADAAAGEPAEDTPAREVPARSDPALPASDPSTQEPSR